MAHMCVKHTLSRDLKPALNGHPHGRFGEIEPMVISNVAPGCQNRGKLLCRRRNRSTQNISLLSPFVLPFPDMARLMQWHLELTIRAWQWNNKGLRSGDRWFSIAHSPNCGLNEHKRLFSVVSTAHRDRTNPSVAVRQRSWSADKGHTCTTSMATNISIILRHTARRFSDTRIPPSRRRLRKRRSTECSTELRRRPRCCSQKNCGKLFLTWSASVLSIPEPRPL